MLSEIPAVTAGYEFVSVGPTISEKRAGDAFPNAGRSVGLNEKPPARETKARARQRLHVLSIVPGRLVDNPDRLERQLAEVTSDW